MQREMRFLNLAESLYGTNIILNSNKYLLPKKSEYTEYFSVLKQNEMSVSFFENRKTSTYRMKVLANPGRQTLILDGKNQNIKTFIIPEPISLARLDRVYIRFINISSRDILITRPNGEGFAERVRRGKATLFMSARTGQYSFLAQQGNLLIKENLTEQKLFSFILYEYNGIKYKLISERNKFFDI